MKLFFPDCLWNPRQVSGASFLYFHDEKIGFSLHPSVSAQLTGVNPFTFLPYLEKESPPWKDSFLEFFNLWLEFRTSLDATHELLQPLREKSFATIMLAYNRGEQGWNSGRELIEASSLSLPDIVPLIDPYHAADELFSHIFFEMVLRVRYGDLTTEQSIELGKRAAQRHMLADGDGVIEDFDWRPVLNYCDGLFGKQSLSELLVQAYMFRVPILRDSPSVLLSNPNLIRFLASLPITANEDGGEQPVRIADDVIAWEFFRQLVSMEIDPLDPNRVRLISTIASTRKGEIDRLKNRCFELAGNLAGEKDLERLLQGVRDTIRAKVANELQELFQIDNRALSALFTKLFSDEKNWIATSAFILGLLSGGDVVTAGAAIYGLSKAGANAFKQAADRRVKLSTSAYTLLYRMKQ